MRTSVGLVDVLVLKDDCRHETDDQGEEGKRNRYPTKRCESQVNQRLAPGRRLGAILASIGYRRCHLAVSIHFV